MTELYPWFVLVHLVGLVLFATSHGVSAFIAFRVREERDPKAIVSLLETSRGAVSPMYVGLLLLIVGGLGAAAGADLWTEPWVIGSIVVFVAVVAVMYSVASPYYGALRVAVGAPGPKGPGGEPTVGPAELATMLDTRRPEILVTVGSVGLLVLLWLMVLKPG